MHLKHFKTFEIKILSHLSCKLKIKAPVFAVCGDLSGQI